MCVGSLLPIFLYKLNEQYILIMLGGLQCADVKSV